MDPNLLPEKKKKVSFIKRTKRFIYLCITLLILLFIAFLIFNVGNLKTRLNNAIDSLYSLDSKTEDAIITKIEEKQELVVLDVSLSQSITLDDTFFNIDLFKKIQKLDFHGNGVYAISLANINESDITFDKGSNTFTLKIDKPYILSIDILKDETVIHSPENGLLRLGSVTLTPETLDNINSQIKEKMEEKLKTQEFISKAESASKKTMKAFIKGLNLLDNDTKIVIEIKE